MKVRWTNNFPSNDNYKWKQWFSWLYTRFTAFKWKTWWHMSKYIFVYILCLRKHSIIDSESINSSSKFRITTFSFGKSFIKYKYGEVRSTKILYWFPDYFNREKLKIRNILRNTSPRSYPTHWKLCHIGTDLFRTVITVCQWSNDCPVVPAPMKTVPRTIFRPILFFVATIVFIETLSKLEELLFNGT